MLPAIAPCLHLSTRFGRDEVLEFNANDIHKMDVRTSQDVGETLKGKDFDVVLDCVGGADNWRVGREVLRKGEYGQTATGPALAVWRAF